MQRFRGKFPVGRQKFSLASAQQGHYDVGIQPHTDCPGLAPGFRFIEPILPFDRVELRHEQEVGRPSKASP